MWTVYILETQDGRLYTGITNNLERRMKAHKNGKGARFTKIFGFKKLLYSEDLPTRVEALKRESFIKTWPREKKLLLALGDTKGTPVPRKERLQNHIDIKKLVKD